ncbi:hypothetical protein KUW14_08760 [Pseudooceanicola nitratireducens]|nr:hypothetical protein [Pseudooceanicola nitratireducens]
MTRSLISVQPRLAVGSCRCPNRARANNIVNERGLYKLIMRSRNPQAVEFQDWVCKVMAKLDGTALKRPLRGVQGQCCDWGSDSGSPL